MSRGTGKASPGGARPGFDPVRALEVRYAPQLDRVRTVGRLAALRQGIAFEYDADWVANPLQLSPYHLPVRPRPFMEPREPFNGLSGLFADALPDAFGRLVMDRAFAMHGADPKQVTPLDRLAVLGTRAMGALTFHPEQLLDSLHGVRIDLGQIAANAEDVIQGRASDVLPELIAAGGSPGGARPKVVVSILESAWGSANPEIVAGPELVGSGHTPIIVKFNAPIDAVDAGRVEAAYADMARAAGISIPRTRLLLANDLKRGGQQAFFAAERFDRVAGGSRVHMHTASGLLHLPAEYAALEYAVFLGVVRDLTRDHRAVEEGYRRMVFNVLAHNHDDHTKNIAFTMDEDGEWHMAPAYDLTYAPGPGGEHTMLVHGRGRDITRADLNEVAVESSISKREAERIIEQVAQAVSEWQRFAQAHDVPRERIQAIGTVLNTAAAGAAGVTASQFPVAGARTTEHATEAAPGADDATVEERVKVTEAATRARHHP